MRIRRMLAAGAAVTSMAAVTVFSSPAQAATVPGFDHIFVIVMENHSYGEIIGSSSSTYVNGLLPAGALATSYRAVTHPSLPNYLALAGGSTFGITSDCTTCWVSAPNLADSLESAGSSWKAYLESMPSPCYIGDSYPYAQKHNPFIYFNDIRTNSARCQSHIVPYTQLSSDLKSASTTPNYAFITPNMCNDTHDCSIATGDAWLRQQVPLILGSPAFTSQRSLLALTWDEDDSSGTNQVPTILLGKGVAAGVRSGTSYNHYSLLHTVEIARGLSTLTSNDAGNGQLGDLFSAPAAPISFSLSASQSSTEFVVGISGATCSGASYEMQQYDTTLGQGWYALHSTPTASGATSIVEGFPGHGYQVRGRVHCGSGSVGTWGSVSTTVATTASWAHSFQSLYTLDWYGGVHPDDSAPLSSSAYWPGSRVARVAHLLRGSNQAGAVLDSYGGLHSFGAPIAIKASASWPGWNIARDFAFLANGSGGYVLDAYGGLHPFAVNGNPMPPAAVGGGYWSGWDIARRVAIFSDGTGGYVLDGFGGIHPFAIGAQPRPATVQAGYWPHWDIIHDFALIPGTHSGYEMDGFGGIHRFAPVGQPLPPAVSSNAYWPNWDIARGMVLLGRSTIAAPSGYVLDGYGGLHPFGGAPNIKSFAYWGGSNIASACAGY